MDLAARAAGDEGVGRGVVDDDHPRRCRGIARLVCGRGFQCVGAVSEGRRVPRRRRRHGERGAPDRAGYCRFETNIPPVGLAGTVTQLPNREGSSRRID